MQHAIHVLARQPHAAIVRPRHRAQALVQQFAAERGQDAARAQARERAPGGQATQRHRDVCAGLQPADLLGMARVLLLLFCSHATAVGGFQARCRTFFCYAVA